MASNNVLTGNDKVTSNIDCSGNTSLVLIQLATITRSITHMHLYESIGVFRAKTKLYKQLCMKVMFLSIWNRTKFLCVAARGYASNFNASEDSIPIEMWKNALARSMLWKLTFLCRNK